MSLPRTRTVGKSKRFRPGADVARSGRPLPKEKMKNDEAAVKVGCLNGLAPNTPGLLCC